MSNESKILEMLTLQDTMNQVIHPDWKNQGYDWRRAMWVEAAEMIEHSGWKWWKKKQESDIEQIKLELVDIWHFMLSDICLTEGSTFHDSLDDLVHYSDYDSRNFNKVKFNNSIEDFCFTVLSIHDDYIQEFFDLCEQVSLSIDEIYKLYIGKNRLNLLRQNQGYKEGTYQKMWFGQEDNVHLMEILNSLSGNEEDFGEVVYGRLYKKYWEAVS